MLRFTCLFLTLCLINIGEISDQQIDVCNITLSDNFDSNFSLNTVNGCFGADKEVFK